VDKPVVIHQSFSLPFQGFLFNQDAQIIRQASREKIWFYLMKDKKPIGRFILHIDQNEGKSPFRAPFGSFEFLGKISFDSLDEFVKEVLKFCEERKLKSLMISSYPFSYDVLNSPAISSVLSSNGFEILTTDLNFHIDLSLDFLSLLHHSEKRRLNKSEKEGFSFEILDLTYCEKMHQLIRDCRERKGFPLSMQKSELGQLFIDFPNDYIAFGLKDKEKLIATSVGVKVNDAILYDFLPADDEAYKSFSPMVLLKRRIMEYARHKGFKIFDLGIATAAGIPNYGLIRFKENLGGIPSLKFSFIKKLR
jgi:hypothetical protein